MWSALSAVLSQSALGQSALGQSAFAPSSQSGHVPVAPAVRAASSPEAPVPGGRLPLPFRGGPLFTGVNVVAAEAVALQMASNNERFDGASLRMLTVQLSRTLFSYKGNQFSWVVEGIPAIVARVGAPANRMPSPTRDPEIFRDSVRFARYALHDVFGVGLAPFGAEVSRQLSTRLSGAFGVTAGGAVFNGVVPYGKATQANFSVAPSLMLSWHVAPGYDLAGGYALHHLSNASFGDANPGLNSHLLFMRVARARRMAAR